MKPDPADVQVYISQILENKQEKYIDSSHHLYRRRIKSHVPDSSINVRCNMNKINAETKMIH